MKRALSFALCATVLILIDCGKKQIETDYAMISFFIGDVSKNGSGGLAIGDTISENDIIATGAQSSCDIKIGSSIIRVKEKSKMLFSSLAMKDNVENTSLDLAEGRILCKPKKLLKDESFTVKTPTAIAAVRGTEFTVEADANKTTRIKVYDGKLQVAKRIKPFENSTVQVMENAPSLEEKQSVVITEKDVAATEKKVEMALAADKDADISKIIADTKADTVIGAKEIRSFSVEDFSKEGSELIAVKVKEPEVLKQVKEVIRKDTVKEEKPAPEGRLLITRYEIYFIKNGRVEWEGKIITPPIKENGKLYIASEDFIFCASPDGPVFWKKAFINDGKIEVKGNIATIYIKGKPQSFDANTGKEHL
jgi:hypothetical protein